MTRRLTRARRTRGFHGRSGTSRRSSRSSPASPPPLDPSSPPPAAAWARLSTAPRPEAPACVLERICHSLRARLPRVLRRSWTSPLAISAAERSELELLHGPGSTAELLVVPPDDGVDHFVVGGSILPMFLNAVQTPLQHSFAFAVPCDAALAALAGHAPICEIGAGTGYWGGLLRERGVECVLYDAHPPGTHDGGRNAFHRNAFHSGATFTTVEVGGAEKAAEHPDHTLLLVWPYSQAMAKADEGQVPWDAAALQAFRGRMVAHVGDLDAASGITTTSQSFCLILRETFDLVQTVALPCWPHVADELTIWRRRPFLAD